MRFREDPQIQELNKRDKELEHMTRELVRRFREADSPDQEEFKRKLTDVVNQHFEVRQQRRARMLERMRKQLERLEKAIQRRNESRDTIVERRIAQLTGEEHELDF